MYEDEELSELSEEEEDQLAVDNKEPSGSRRKTASEGYSLQRALKPPRATTYTAQALYDQIHSGDVELSPEYQRDVVWTKEKQTNLIDSILRNFYIPPIIFAVNSFEDGTESKTCIDGKQRLTSIHRFMDGLIPHRDPITGEKLWFRDDPSESSKAAKKRKLLPERYRTMFSNKQIVCVEYTDLTDADERDIFQRVQLGMALTSAEKLHVINTPRAQFIRNLLSEFISDDKLGSASIPWDTNRGSDFRCIGQAVYAMDKWPSTKTGTPLKNAGTLPQVEKWLSAGADKKGGKQNSKDDADFGRGPDIPEAFAKKVRETFSLMVQLATDEELSSPFTLYPKISPIEMICISLLIYVHGVLPSSNAKMDPTELSEAIEDMRRDVRVQHKDIRLNDRVGKTMVEFIQVSSKTSSKKSPKQAVSAPAPTTKAKGKRRRVSEANVDSDYEDYQPRKRTMKKPKPQVAVRSKPLPTPTSSTTDHLASGRAAKAARSARAAHRASSPPNPQRLPSPGPASDAVVKTEPSASGSQTPMSQPNIPLDMLTFMMNTGMANGVPFHPFSQFSQEQLTQMIMTNSLPQMTGMHGMQGGTQ